MKKTAKKHYLKLVEWSAEDGCYVGRCPELFYGGVHGSDEAKVYRELCEVVEEVIAMKTAHHDPLPETLDAKKFSGRFVLRVDPATHKALALRALSEGVSLNAFCALQLGSIRQQEAAASRWLARMGGTMPNFETASRRRSKAIKQ